MSEEFIFLQGNEAIVEGALYAGCRFFAGYPITPSSEIMEEMASKLFKVGGVFIQMEDEIASIAAAIGASWAGRKAMTATSGPGFSLMQENIGFAIITETPLVIVNAQRGGPSTGQPTLPSQSDVMQARWGTHGDHSIIALSPNSVQECYDLTVEAFNLSEKYRTPVILLTEADTSHMREGLILKRNLATIEREVFEKGPVAFPFQAEESQAPPFPFFGRGHRVHITGLSHTITGYPVSETKVQEELLRRIIDKVDKNRRDICKVQVVNPDASLILVAYGLPSRAAMEVVRRNKDVGLFRLISLWPFPREEFMEVASKAKAILVLEMNEGQIVREVERYARRAGCRRVELLPKIGGEVHTPQEIEARIKEMRISYETF